MLCSSLGFSSVSRGLLTRLTRRFQAAHNEKLLSRSRRQYGDDYFPPSICTAEGSVDVAESSRQVALALVLHYRSLEEVYPSYTFQISMDAQGNLKIWSLHE
jgi:hypothetical protein